MATKLSESEARGSGSLRHGFRALQVRNYRLFFIGQLISQTGGWMQQTAQAWLVLILTGGDPVAVGLVTALRFLPITLLTLVGGVLTDQMPKRKLLLITQTAALLQASCFALLVGLDLITIYHVYVLAALQGLIIAIDNPVRQTFVGEMVGRDHVSNAVALNSMVFNGARIIGPAVAGLIIATVGITPTLVFNAVSYLAVIAGLLLMDESALLRGEDKAKGPMLERLREGLDYAWRTPEILLVLMVVTAIGTFGYNFSVMLPLLADHVLHTDSAGFGGLNSFLGIGSVAAGLVVASLGQVSFKRLMVGSAIFSVVLAGVGLSTSYVLTAGLLMLLGAAGIAFSTSANTLLQLITPDQLRGRVMSLYVLLFAGTTPLGGMFIGTLAALFGVKQAILMCALMCGIGVLGALVYGRRKAVTPALPSSEAGH